MKSITVDNVKIGIDKKHKKSITSKKSRSGLIIVYDSDTNKHHVNGRAYRYVKKIPFDKLDYKEQSLILEVDKLNE